MQKLYHTQIPNTENYAFCEPSYVGSNRPWHIRKLSNAGKMLGGGADTLTLCGRDLCKGWDIDVIISQNFLDIACSKCVTVLQSQLKGKE